MRLNIIHITVAGLCWVLCFQTGCKSPADYRSGADKTAADVIGGKQKEALGHTEEFSVERPSDILRRRLLAGQNLPYYGDASLGADKLSPVKHWPEKNYPGVISSTDTNIPVESNKPVKLSLIDVLQVGARNSADYQSQKEAVFQAALALDLKRNNFRNIFNAQAKSSISKDTTGDSTVNNLDNSGKVGVSRSLMNGIGVTGTLAVNLAKLLTQGGASVLGLSADTTVSIPLLRGAGQDIAAEPLTQAERSVVYQIWTFERFKRTFAVSIAGEYFNVLQQMDALENAKENYRSAISSARWSRRRADAGRIREIDVDQAKQRQLSARNNWISAESLLMSQLDSFKKNIGLPPDAQIELDRNDLEQLRSRAITILEKIRTGLKDETPAASHSADDPVELAPASHKGAGPLEMDESLAVKLALKNRLDLCVAVGGVVDAQRQVVVKADALRAELTLGGVAKFEDTEKANGSKVKGGSFAAPLTLDLPVERTKERNDYRNSLIDLEKATRAVQSLEDQIKLSIRNELRALLESRESLTIQAESVVVAEKRVRSSTMFLEAGRIEIRDLLDAQDALLSAQNLLTQAVVTYRLAELQLQRDLDVLKVNQQGFWQEFSPEELNHVKQ